MNGGSINGESTDNTFSSGLTTSEGTIITDRLITEGINKKIVGGTENIITGRLGVLTPGLSPITISPPIVRKLGDPYEYDTTWMSRDGKTIRVHSLMLHLKTNHPYTKMHNLAFHSTVLEKANEILYSSNISSIIIDDTILADVWKFMLLYKFNTQFLQKLQKDIFDYIERMRLVIGVSPRVSCKTLIDLGKIASNKNQQDVLTRILTILPKLKMTEEEFEMMDNKLKDSCLRYLLDISNQNDGKEVVKIEKMDFEHFITLANKQQIEIGTKIEAQDKHGCWYVAQVVTYNTHTGDMFVHYCGWGSPHDEWYSRASLRRLIAPLGTRKIDSSLLCENEVRTTLCKNVLI